MKEAEAAESKGRKSWLSRAKGKAAKGFDKVKQGFSSATTKLFSLAVGPRWRAKLSLRQRHRTCVHVAMHPTTPRHAQPQHRRVVRVVADLSADAAAPL